MTKTQGFFPLTDIRPISANILKATFSSALIAKSAKPGQFVHVKCGHSRPLRRPFGICDIVRDQITIVFEVRGEGTKWLAGRSVGDRLDVLGPLGNGFTNLKGNTLIVGGGLGVTPLLYAARNAGGKSIGLLGFRSRDNVILMKEFESLCSSVLITTDDGSFGLKGSVAKPMDELLSTLDFSSVIACGPRPMLKAVSEIAAYYNVDCQVSLEEKMGCGIGACLVCACKTISEGKENMSRVCKDGPVFNGQEVVW